MFLSKPMDPPGDYAGFPDLRTWRSGPAVFIDFYPVMQGRIAVQESRDLADHTASDLRVGFPAKIFPSTQIHAMMGASAMAHSAHFPGR
jgi:hypothetical protein